MLDQLSDEQLMSSFTNPNDINHHRAFEILYQRHKGPMYGFIKKSMNNEQDANELFQDLWFKIIQHKNDFDPLKKFSTWAYTIARRMLIDHYRKTAKTSAHIKPDETLAELSEDPLQQPDNELDRKTMALKLQSAIHQLPIDQRQAFVLRHGSGFTLKQIAQITDQAIEKTKSQYRYAVQKLKVSLERFK